MTKKIIIAVGSVWSGNEKELKVVFRVGFSKDEGNRLSLVDCFSKKKLSSGYRFGLFQKSVLC